MAHIGGVRGIHRTSAVHLQYKKASKGKKVDAFFKKIHFDTTHRVAKAVSDKDIHLEGEIKSALLLDHTARVKELLRKAKGEGRNIYNDLQSDAKMKNAFDAFKKLYCEVAVEESISQASVKPLNDPLALQCGIAQMPKKFFISTLKDVGSERAIRVANEIEALSHIPFSRHKLDALNSYTVCLVADRELRKLANKTKAAYIRADEVQTPRSFVIDPHHHTFTILSKKFGELDAQGAFKRVSDAVEIASDGKRAKARRVAHIRNKADEHIPTEELEFEMRYGDVIAWTRYKSKKRPYETKTLILEEVYDHDLYVFTEFTSEQLRKKISFVDMLEVLEAVGSTLSHMHKDGLIHRDVKAKNVLFRRTPDGKVEAKLIDFGHCYAPTKSNALKKRKKGYGTLRYTAPDLLENPALKGDRLFLAKAEDSYALGQIIYEVYLQKATPWGSLTYRALKKQKNAEENRATAISLQKSEASFFEKESSMLPHTPEKELLRIMSRLLDPNPFTRMQIPEFMTALYDLKTESATLAPATKDEANAYASP